METSQELMGKWVDISNMPQMQLFSGFYCIFNKILVQYAYK